MIEAKYDELISERIKESNVNNKLLVDDLIDHFCCLVEIKMGKGASIEEAYHQAYQQTTPNGLDEIQKETIFLLNYNKLKLMKGFTYVTGYVFTLAWSIGVLFKLLHLPGAGVLLGVGGIGIETYSNVILNNSNNDIVKYNATYTSDVDDRILYLNAVPESGISGITTYKVTMSTLN